MTNKSIQRRAEEAARSIHKFRYSHEISTDLLPKTGLLETYIKSHNGADNLPESLTTSISSVKDDKKDALIGDLKATLKLSSEETGSTQHKTKQSIDLKLQKALAKRDMLHKLIADKNSYINASHIYSYVAAREEKIRILLDEQLKINIEAVEKYFKSKEIEGKFESKDDEKKAKDGLIAALKNQVDEIKKDSIEKVEALLKEIGNQEDRIATLARLSQNKEMYKEIQRMHENSKPQTEGVILSSGRDENKSITLRGVDLNKLNITHTLNGRRINKGTTTIEVEEEIDGKIVKKPKVVDCYSIDLPNKLSPWALSKRLSGGFDEWKKEAWKDVIGMLRASGYKTITLSMSHDDEKTAKADLMIQIQAALECGYKIEDMTFEINGKSKSINEIFEGNPSKLEQIKKEADIYEQAYEAEKKRLSDSRPNSLDNFKKQLKDMRSGTSSQKHLEPEPDQDSAPSPA